MTTFFTTGFFVLLILAGIMGAIAYLINEARKKTQQALYEARNELANAKAAIETRDKFIAKIQEANRNEKQRMEKISTGSDADRFDSSLDVLSGLSKRRH